MSRIGPAGFWVAGCGVTLLAGCVGGVESLIGVGLFAIALLVQGCDKGESGNCNNYRSCIDGRIETERLCCPEGDSCNYGMIAPRMCDDGSCVQGYQALCPGESPDASIAQCTGRVDKECVDGELVDACCPQGAVCNFGLGLKTCPDGSCAYGSCEHACDADAGAEGCVDAGG
jgi:hypothetical protein